MAKRVNEPIYKKFITQPIKRFNETNHAFSRGDRREVPGHHEISDESLKKQFNNIDGYTQEDRALFLAARTINYICRRVTLSRKVPEILEVGHKPRDSKGVQIPPENMLVSNPAEMSKKIKEVAKWLGADLIGITKMDLNWFYSHWGTHTVERYGVHEEGIPIEVPEEYKWAIVMAIEMDYENLKRSPANCATTDLAYSHMAIVSSSLAEFIRELGYKATPLGNEMALSIPMAVDAGLGELGRNGLLITEKFGPRVRICKVITSLPLATDKPIDLGLQAFCEACRRCADTCPGRAVKDGERTDKPWNISNNEGILKWPVDGEKCLDWWAKNGSWCAACIRVCPWNKPNRGWLLWLHKLVRWTISQTSIFNLLFMKGDELCGYGKQHIKPFPQIGKS